uniref:Uncharacterized protein n=1 Tax=Ciona intestinalis TaxID=7719 RepID=H2XXI9_CIOIN
MHLANVGWHLGLHVSTEEKFKITQTNLSIINTCVFLHKKPIIH